MDLVVATGNPGKLREISSLLDGVGIRVAGLGNWPDLPPIIEDGATFADNARLKAEIVARHTGRLTLADDSGLEVPFLGGAPGVRSARYAGEQADDAANNRRLLEQLDRVPRSQRRAAFRCVMALCRPAGDRRFFEGRLDGLILEAPRGQGGFGYDPLFLVPEYGKTLAELPLEVKNRISHRGLALRQVLAHLAGSGDG